MGFQNVDIRQVRKRGSVRDDTREAYLFFAVKQAEAQRVQNGAFDNGDGDARRPVALRQERVNRNRIEATPVGGDRVFVSLCVGRHG